MKLSSKVKERVACVIANFFTTNQIESVFADAGIQVDVSLYAKWKITLDGFRKCSNPEEAIPHIIKEFAHPLSIEKERRLDFIKELDKVLFYDKIKIEPTDTGAKISYLDGTPFEDEDREITKTSTDYLVEAVNFFKNEYNKIRMNGLTYEYKLGDNLALSNFEPEPNEINHAYYRRIAIERLKEIGFVTECEFEERVVDDYGNIVDYAICKIDESKITEQKEAPRPNQTKTEELIQKVIKHEHNHKHSFENSIQEKPVDLIFTEKTKSKKERNHKFPFTIQSGTTWESFYIQFKNTEAVTIQVSGHTHDTSFADMGFADKRTGKPNMQWGFLIALAKNGGSLSASDPDANDKYKKHKQLLADNLKSYFSMDTDPFKTYEKTEGYVLKLSISYPDIENSEQKPDFTNDIRKMFDDLVE